MSIGMLIAQIAPFKISLCNRTPPPPPHLLTP